MPSQQINKHNYIKGHDAFIELSQGEFAIIDADMLSTALHFTWSLARHKGYHWAQANDKVQGVKKTLKLPHLIMGVPLEGYCVDHINGNPLDNRRANLRVCTRQQNASNQTKVSGEVAYRGVRKSGNRYRADLTHKGQRISLGVFDTAEEAAQAYNQAALYYRQDFASLNVIATPTSHALTL